MRGESQLSEILRQRIISALKELLETKHLYQSVTISTQDFDEIIQKEVADHKHEIMLAGPSMTPSTPKDSAQAFLEILNKKKVRLLNSTWEFDPETNAYPGMPPLGSTQSGTLALLTVPSIRASCSSSLCKGSIQPHNSGYTGLREGLHLIISPAIL